MNNQTITWYASLKKPFFAPPSWLFGVAWSILYPIIFVSFGYVFYLAGTKKIPFIVALPFLINIIANLMFSPIQFGLQNNYLAALDITVVVISLIWAIIAIYPHSKIIAFAQVPYLLWGLFATVLQYSITFINR